MREQARDPENHKLTKGKQVLKLNKDLKVETGQLLSENAKIKAAVNNKRSQQ